MSRPICGYRQALVKRPRAWRDGEAATGDPGASQSQADRYSMKLTEYVP